MSIEEASQHINFMRTDLVSISMEGIYALASPDATPKTRAAVERHNARRTFTNSDMDDDVPFK